MKIDQHTEPGRYIPGRKATAMKRYVIEMANDLEKRYPKQAMEIIKIRNAYISRALSEIEAVSAMVKLVWY